MSISLESCRALYAAGAGPASVLISVTAPTEVAEAAAAASPPTFLSCILDVSGSMEGSKLHELKATMQYIVNSLTHNDHLSIVSFNERSRILLPPTQAGNENFRARALPIIDALSAGGGTSVLAGLETGVETLEGEASPRCVKALLLLTDGQDHNGNGRFDAVLARARATGATVQCFGFGADHDARLMSHLAQKGGGLFSYVENAQDVGGSFAACLASLRSTFTKDFTLEVSVPEDGVAGEGEAGAPAPLPPAAEPWEPAAPDARGGAVELLRAPSAYPLTLTPRGLTLRFGALALGEKRTVLVHLALPPLPAHAAAAAAAAAPPRASATHYVLAARVAYTDLATGGARALPPAAAVLQRACGGSAAEQAARIASAAVSVEVDAVRARDEANAVLAAAIAMAENNQHAKAVVQLQEEVGRLRACVAGAAAHPLVTGLMADLAAMATSCASREQYEFGGRAAMSSTAASHTLQRFSGVSSPTSSSSAAYCSPSQTMAMASSPSARRPPLGGAGGAGGARGGRQGIRGGGPGGGLGRQRSHSPPAADPTLHSGTPSTSYAPPPPRPSAAAPAGLWGTVSGWFGGRRGSFGGAEGAALAAATGLAAAAGSTAGSTAGGSGAGAMPATLPRARAQATPWGGGSAAGDPTGPTATPAPSQAALGPTTLLSPAPLAPGAEGAAFTHAPGAGLGGFTAMKEE